MLITIFILRKIANKKFQSEVVSHLHNCNVGLYIASLTKLLGTRRDKLDQSMYACLSSVGYEVLGDYDSLYASCQNIKLKMHMPIYHRRMFSYYFINKDLEHARNEADILTALAAKERNLKEKKVIEDMEAECRRTLRVNDGDYDEALDYFSEMLKSTDPHPLITRVSCSYAYGKLLYLTGNSEAAKEPLLFASSRGGDTKYKKNADELLEKIG
ncbi:MAG: hypothetical protein IJ819_04370 [Clostridiales bacterium]|nr:hypothetical protein [Clostridiales bacterium]